MIVMPLGRKTARLNKRDYIGKGVYFFTVCCARRLPHFSEPESANNTIQALLDTASAKSLRIVAYSVMPDRLHMLAEGTSEKSDALEFIRIFKQRSAFEFRQRRGQTLWELSYYDRVVRSSDSIIEIARYIWWNPVRKKLCHRPQEYPHSGSQTFSWMKEAQIPPRSCLSWPV